MKAICDICGTEIDLTTSKDYSESETGFICAKCTEEHDEDEKKILEQKQATLEY